MPHARKLLTGLAVLMLVALAWREPPGEAEAPAAPAIAGAPVPAPDAPGPATGSRERPDVTGASRDDTLGTRREASAGRRARFDFYLLSLTLEPAFCEDGNQRIRQCRALDGESFARTPLVLHGLWPEDRVPGRYPRDCPGPPLALQPATRAALAPWMPGMREGLDRHEWRSHGTCSGLDDDAYFRHAIAGTRVANLALGEAIRRHAGSGTTAAALRAAADRARPGYGENVVFVCRNLRSDDPAKRRRPHLLEVRVCLDDDGPDGAPGRLLRCADVGRRDQGCGGTFMIDDV